MNRILVTGASGNIGRPLLTALKAQNANVKAMSSKAIAAATTAGATANSVAGDFADPTSLQLAFAGIDTLFLLLPLVPNKLDLARNAVAAAKAAGVKHIVRSSGAGADASSPVALARLQGQIDQMVVDSGLAYTFLRPSGFMQNWTNFSASQIKGGTVYAPHGQGAQSVVDARDIADAARSRAAQPRRACGQGLHADWR